MADIYELYMELTRLYNSMLEVSVQQTALLRAIPADLGQGEDDSGGMERLQQLGVLFDRRDEIAENIEAVNRQIAALTVTDDLVEIIVGQTHLIISVIEEIQANDQVNRQLMLAMKDELQKKIGSVRNNEKAYNAYHNVTVNPWFVDSKK